MLQKIHSGKKCSICGVCRSGQWRTGPPDYPILCNKCGLKWLKGSIITLDNGEILCRGDDPLYAKSDHICSFCSTTQTGQWRHGPPEFYILCNKCGIQWSRGSIISNGILCPEDVIVPKRKVCAWCSSTTSTQWRHGPGSETLCNKCGTRYRRRFLSNKKQLKNKQSKFSKLLSKLSSEKTSAFITILSTCLCSSDMVLYSLGMEVEFDVMDIPKETWHLLNLLVK